MNQQTQTDSFDQINLNLIKNTKLFQKFILNKTTLSNTSAFTPNNSQSTKTDSNQESETPNLKWTKNNYQRQKNISNPSQARNEGNQTANFQQQYQIKENQVKLSTHSKREYLEQEECKNARADRLQKAIHNSAEQRFIVPQKNGLQNLINPNNRKAEKNETYPQHSQSRDLPNQIQNRRKRQFNAKTQFNHQELPQRKLQDLRNTDMDNGSIREPNKPQQSNDSYENSSIEYHERPSPVAFSEAQYRQKYEYLLKKYDEVKLELKNKSKIRKKQFTEWDHEIQLLKEKLFDVQSRQDSLLIENQRLRDKCESQNLIKMKTQQENKELGFKIKELEDQLSIKQSAIKQRHDQSSHWKTQLDSMKQELNSVRLILEKRNDEYSMLYGDYQLTKKERDQKDHLMEELRRNITSLVQQNSAAKDQIFKLVTKLYQLQQQNQVLKNDLKRQNFDHSCLNNYMKELQQGNNISRDRIQSTAVQRHYKESTKLDRSITNQSFAVKQALAEGSFLYQGKKLITDKPNRKRGEFAKQRGQLIRNDKPQRDERPLSTKENVHNTALSDDRPIKFHQNSETKKLSRIQQIQEQLEKIKDIKAINGAIRRKKIDLQRELEVLQDR